jgi:predicted GNAT superfamily acetyltransferase
LREDENLLDLKRRDQRNQQQSRDDFSSKNFNLFHKQRLPTPPSERLSRGGAKIAHRLTRAQRLLLGLTLCNNWCIYPAHRTMNEATEKEIIIRDIEDVDEMRLIEGLEKEVWGIGDLDVVPVTQLVAARHAGGILVGAFCGSEIIGFAYGFPGYEGGHVTVHSHMLAVKSAYRNHNLGYRLKLAQRDRALARGIMRMTWTFDPLQSLNAHFNFAKLGVMSDDYKVDFYGESTSFLHRTGTDRLWVTWLLASERVRSRLAREDVTIDIESAAAMVGVGENDSPRSNDSVEALARERLLIEIPANIVAVEQSDGEVAALWREATRRAFTRAMDAGFLVEEFIRSNRNGKSFGAYVLSRGKRIEDFV